MKTIGKKRILICILLLIAICVEFIAYRMERSKGQNVKNIAVTLTEYNSQSSETIEMQAIYGNQGYYIILPEYINNKVVNKYYVDVNRADKLSKVVIKDNTIQAMKEKNQNVKIQKVVDVKNPEEVIEDSENKTNTESENTNQTVLEETKQDNTVQDTPAQEQPTQKQPAQKQPTESVPENNVENETVRPEEKQDEPKDNKDNTVQNEPVTTPSEDKEEEIPQEIIDAADEIEQTSKIVELLPKETLYLTEAEAKNGKVDVQVQYDTKAINGNILYSQKVTKEINSAKIEVSGYLPKNAEVLVEPVQNEEVIDSVDSVIAENSAVEQLFTLKILDNGKEFDCKANGVKIKVKINVESTENEYKVLEFDSSKISGVGVEKQDAQVSKVSNNVQEKIEENLTIRDENNQIQNQQLNIKNSNVVKLANTLIDENAITERDVIMDANSVTFETDSLTTFALVQTVATNGTETDTIEAVVTTGAKWDGTVATSFSGGDGTSGKPYLILDGSELAYLAQQVNNGNSYDGKYFQLAGDIDLNSRTWTPIGNTTNSFSGIFDGGGHSISNATIETTTSLQYDTTYSYGIFGSIQGNSAIAEIRNTEFNNIEVNINNLANYAEVHVGIVTGTMYRKSKIFNVLVKNGKTEVTRNISVNNNSLALLVGGIAGEARDTATSTQDPGEGNRYSIENCYVSVTMENDSVYPSGNTRNSTYLTYVAQISSGGIIGRIRSQNVWPENCLVTANIEATGFIGPIFGSLYNNTTYTNYNNLNTLWMGNDAAGNNNLTMTSYYNSYSANGTVFTSTNINGTTPSNTTYRRNANITSTGWRTTYNIGYIQGMNKGNRLTDTSSMTARFNNYSQDDNINFVYSNGEFLLQRRITAGVTDNGDMTYTITTKDPYNIGNYTYSWYINDQLDEEKTNATEAVKNESFSDNMPVKVIVSDGQYFGVVKFAVPRLFVRIDFDVDYSDTSNFKINATLAGPGVNSSLYHLEDYDFKWYKLDIAGLSEELVEGANSLTLENAEDGLEYKLVATNNSIAELSAQGSQVVGERNVVYLDYSYGNDNRLGDTPETSVRTLSRAYNLLPSTGSRNRNIIVVMDDYTTANSYNDSVSTVYDKNATITGAYGGTRYSPYFYMYSSDYKYLLGDTTFQYLTFYGGYSSLYMYAQGYDLLMGEEVTMTGYTTAGTSQGLISGTAPSVHIFGGWCRYNRTTLPANDQDGTRHKAEIVIKSGTYGRIIGGGATGSSGSQYLYNTTSHNFLGSNLTNDSYDIEITIDIKNSTTADTYSYDVNLLCGGSASGNTYGNSTLNIYNGSVGRALGASIGNSSYAPYNGSNHTSNANWTYPVNTFIGTATVNIEGGSITELYGGALGRNMAVQGTNNTGKMCDSYFYGTITVNMSGGTVSENVYGAGAGGVTGYSTLSSDPYKNYGASIATSVNLNISGGTILSNVYGGGYGYTNYLNNQVITEDGGTLYGNSNINISGSPVIKGSVFASGCGYSLETRPKLAQQYGNTTINVSGSPTITGSIFGAGAGISGLDEMAKLVGNANLNLNSDLTCDVYGGGNIAKVEGNIRLYINSGTHSGSMYGGGNVGIVDGTTIVEVNGSLNTGNIFGGGNRATVTETTVNAKGGTNNNSVFGGGNKAPVGKSTVNILGGINKNIFGCGNEATSDDSAVYIDSGNTQNVYGGGNETDVTLTKVYLRGGTANNLYGGSNASGIVTETNISATSGTATTIYGGNNAGGTVTTSNVVVDGGSIGTVHGGNNAAGTVTTSNVTINNSVGIVYGGNNIDGTTQESNVIINAGTIENIFGGGNQAVTGTTNVTINNGKITNTFGGGNKAGISNKTNVTVLGGKNTNVYGGSNQSGTVEESNVIINAESELQEGEYNVANVFGGNNAGGVTKTPNVTINKGVIQNVFGGGDSAEVNSTNVNILNGTIDDVYGGGNAASVNGNTQLLITGGTINNNVYGGGNEGPVAQNSNATIQNVTILGSAYGGGNGVGAIVLGNSQLNVLGNTIVGSRGCSTPSKGCVFGGGNAAATGTSDENSSRSILNVVGGTIYGNTYGGANTSVIYGKAIVNIGKEAVANDSYEQGDIHIYGTSFGGGEANTSGSEVFDWDTIIVTGGIDVTIDAQGYDTFLIDGSIFGSGNASATSGISKVLVKNYGTVNYPKSNISLQRANEFVLYNSAIALDGASDRANEYSNVYYSISRIDDFKLENNSTLYLNYGANLLKKYSSILVSEDGTETLATANIDKETGATARNVDNRIYMLEGKNLNIATNENVTSYGEVNGMTFLGLYTSIVNPASSTAYYNSRYNNGDEITNAGTFSLNSYVSGAHKKDPEHDITKDGFYTNKNNEGYIKSEYVGVTPPDDTYYLWVVGDAIDVTVYEITLTASKYATLGTLELPLTGFSTPNTKFVISGYTVAMKNGIELIDYRDIDAIAPTEELANSKFGLNMKNGKSGWITNNSNNFLSANEGTYTGRSLYQTENTSVTPSLTFCLYHSQNISVEQSLGSGKIRFQVLIPVDDLNYRIAYADVVITMLSDLYQDDFYEAAITPGEEFELFTTTETNITSKSEFSVYYSLYIPLFSSNDLYDDYRTYERCLVSRDIENVTYVYPKNTKITMIDLVTHTTYYYVVTEEDENSNKNIYKLVDFVKMGSTNEHYNPNANYGLYYNNQQDILYENYIFQIDFGEANLSENLYDKTLFMELQDNAGETLVGVLGIQREATKYSVYKNQDAVISAQTEISPEISYLGKNINLDVTTNFKQDIVSTKTIYDTTFFNQKLGLKISIFDSEGNQLNSDSLLGVFFELDGNRYYPRIDGTTRIKVADRVSNVLSRIIINTSQNTTLATDTYTIKIETFGSSDGIYYGLVASDYTECNVYIINGAYGLKVTTSDREKIINKDTGENQTGTNQVECNIEYSSALDNPTITVSLERRDYSSVYSNDYNQVNLTNYVTSNLYEFTTNEYIVTDTPAAKFKNVLNFGTNLETGTYKLVYKLYDRQTYIGEAYEYIIIR